MNEIRHISIFISSPPESVYEFAAKPENLPRCPAGLALSPVRQHGDHWIVEAPFGRAKVKFAPQNSFGVLDHDVELETGLVIHNPMRVIPNGKGSEFIFTLIRQSDTSDEAFLRDISAIEQDLQTLKTVLEIRPEN